MAVSDISRTLWWQVDETTGRPAVYIIDQSRLPLAGDVLVCSAYEGVQQAIAGMAVRGAPALGVAAAFGVALWAANETAQIETTQEFLAELDRVAADIASTRPTAVNLAWGAERMRSLAHRHSDLAPSDLRDLLVAEGQEIRAEDEERNRAIGRFGADLLPNDARVLTHCNAGSLATAYFGTALGVIFTAHEEGKIAGVWVDETRPLLQGSRLTAWELRMAGVPFRIVVDSAAGSLMRAGLVDAVIVGADRIAANGDVVNKIGTYGLAVLAKEHGVPFYVAAPTSTVDLTLEAGDGAVIEERDPREVLGIAFSGVVEPRTPVETASLDALTREAAWEIPIAKGHAMELSRRGGAFRLDGWARLAPPEVEVFNPAFDVTPGALVTAIVTERGVARLDYTASLSGICEGSGAVHELR